MGRAPCCDKANVKRGPWSPEEDAKLKDFIQKSGTGGNWIALPQKAGLKRCGKSCRLRWLNYLRPNIKHGDFSEEDDTIICTLYATIGSRWSIIAAQLPGRTDNDIKNYWNTKLKKKLMGIHTNNNQTSQRRSSSTFTSYHQIPSQQVQSLATLSHLFQNCSPFHTEAKSLTSLESIPLLSPNLQNMYSNNNCVSLAENHHYSPCFQTQEGLMMNLGQNYPLKDTNFLTFGGNNNEASCSSSDGSCTQMSYGNKEIKQESMNLLQGYMSNGGFHEANEQKMINLDYGSSKGDCLDNFWKQGKGIFGSPQYQLLQNDIEEVKQLIRSSSNDNSFKLNDESKTHERTMYFY